MPTQRAPRKFGIEIECFNINAATRAIVRGLGWTVKDDGSIRGNDTAEIVSPPLVVSDAAYESVRRVTAAIREGGGRVNMSCGLHVHVEARDDLRVCNPGRFFTNLVARYASLEDQIDFLVPYSRRESRNQYCASTKQLVTFLETRTVERFYENLRYDAEILQRQNVQVSPAEALQHRGERLLAYLQSNAALGNVMYCFRCTNRYYKVNFNAYIQHGTVEFRQFGASLNSTKIIAWVKFCMNLMDRSRAMTLKTRQFRKVYSPAQLQDPFFGMEDRAAVRYLKARMEENRANPNPIRNPARHLQQRRAARNPQPVVAPVTPEVVVPLVEAPATNIGERIHQAAEEHARRVPDQRTTSEQIAELLRLAQALSEENERLNRQVSVPAPEPLPVSEPVTVQFTPGDTFDNEPESHFEYGFEDGF